MADYGDLHVEHITPVNLYLQNIILIVRSN